MPAVKKDGIVFAKSSKKAKKYKATFPDGKVVHLGAASYPQFKDGAGLGLQSQGPRRPRAPREFPEAARLFTEAKEDGWVSEL